MSAGVSVIICTYNGAQRLPKTLKHLARQEAPENLPWEIILINNASTDRTLGVAHSELAKYPGIKAKIIEQPIPGKINAIRKGFSEAEYDTVILCDDDNWLQPNYIRIAAEVLLSDPLIAVIGGCGYYEPELPTAKEIAGFEICYVNGPQEWASTQHWVYGAGAVYRKHIFNELFENGWQLITPGRTGGKLNGGEDAEFCFMAYLMGYKIISEKRLGFRHFVPRSRQNIDYILNLNFWLSYSNVLLNSYHAITNNSQKTLKATINSWCINSLSSLFKQTALILFHRCRHLTGSTLKQKIDYQSTLGTLMALINSRKKIVRHNRHLLNLLEDSAMRRHSHVEHRNG